MLPVKRFIDYIQQNQLFDRGSRILAAVSGGMDSVLMVRLLHGAGFKFAVAHCNFKLRSNESDTDEQFCRNLAQQLDVPFYTIAFDTLAYAAGNKMSVQMAARELRYQWFEQMRQQHHFEVIALAHHQNDTIETILLNLVRGTGIAGLHGIMPRNGLLVRPMLSFTREEIQQAVTANEISFREDSSNASVKYARNKLRLEVIPKLKELNPALENTFSQHLRHFRELEKLLDQKLAETRHRLFQYQGNDLYLPVNLIRELNPQHLLLAGLLKPFGFSEAMVDDVISVLGKHAGRSFETATHRLVLDRENLILSALPARQMPNTTVNADTVSISYGRYRVTVSHQDGSAIIRNNPLKVAVDHALLVYPLQVRSWRQSDYFYPLGMKTRKKLSDFFINQKVPLHQKNQVPIIENGNGDIVWVGGYRPDERYKVSGQTKKITIFEIQELP